MNFYKLLTLLFSIIAMATVGVDSRSACARRWGVHGIYASVSPIHELFVYFFIRIIEQTKNSWNSELVE